MFIIIRAGLRLQLLIAIIVGVQSAFGQIECPVPNIPNGKFDVVEPDYQLGKSIPDSGIIKVTCNEGYSIDPSGDETVYCKSGAYNKTLPQCLISECGELLPEDLNGERRSFPWHVGFYRKRPNMDTYEHACAGSIISANKVVTVAHCFYLHEDKLVPLEEYYIVTGKDYSDYNAIEDNARKVSHVAILPNYRGISTKYQGDLAVASVDTPFVFSKIMKPVCIDWQSLYEDDQLKSNNLGQLVELYATEYTSANITFKRISVPFVDRGQCLNAVPKEFIQFVTTDKFCAGYTDGTNLGGISGAGIVFEQKQSTGTKFFLRGILSTGPSKNGERDKSSYAAYTKLSTYLNFIQD